jgi:hypothetical protein
MAIRLGTTLDELLPTLIELQRYVEAKTLTIQPAFADFDKALAERFHVYKTIGTIFDLSVYLSSMPELFVAKCKNDVAT